MRRAALAIGLALLLSPAALAGTFSHADIALSYDSAVWRLAPSVPPTILTLDCIDPACGPKATLIVVEDTRPFLLPGAGAFTPGAVSVATLERRAAALAPRARLLTQEAMQPRASGALPSYRGRFIVEATDLSRRDLLHAAVRRPHGLLLVAFFGDRLEAGAVRHFDRLLDGFSIEGTATP
jgi:hypothetical protein